MKLDDANKIYFGAAEVDRVYIGANKVWEFVGGEVAPAEPDYLVASFTPGSYRQDYTGYVGMKFTPTRNMTVIGMGAMRGSGMSGDHTVVLQDLATLTTLRSAAVNMANGVEGAFVYADVASVTLTAGTAYVLRKQATANDGQWWRNLGPTTLYDATDVVSTYGPIDAVSTSDPNAMFVGVDIVLSSPFVAGSLKYRATGRYGLGALPTGPWFSGIPIGIPYPTRRVLLCMEYCYNGIAPASNITIGGVVATVIAVHTGTHPSVGAFGGEFVWAYADVPTGTIVDIDFDNGQIEGGGYVIGAVYTFNKSMFAAAPSVAFTDLAPATSNTISINTVAGGFTVIGATWDFFGNTTTMPAITAATETYKLDYNVVNFGTAQKDQIYSIIEAGAATPSSVTLSWSNACASLVSILTWDAK